MRKHSCAECNFGGHCLLLNCTEGAITGKELAVAAQESKLRDHRFEVTLAARRQEK